MSQVIKLAWGEESRYTGDLRTHAVSINPTQVEQFYIANAEDGAELTYSIPQVGLNFACRQCHSVGFPKNDQELIDGAYGYHERPAEPPVLPTQTPTSAP